MQLSQSPNAPSIDPRPHDEASVRADAFAEILSYARKNPSKSNFFGNTLRCIARMFGSPYAALHVRLASEVIQDDCHTGPTDPSFWKGSLQQFLTEALAEPRSRARLLRAKTGSTKVAFLSTPIFDPAGPAIGAVAIVVTPVTEQDVAVRLASLEALARLASFTAEFLGVRDSHGVPEQRFQRTSFSVGAMARASSCATPEEFAFALTNELCNKLGCEQVSLSTVTRNHVRVLSISGMDTVPRQSPGVTALTAAMEECLDARTPIVVQRGGGWAADRPDTVYRLHKQWHAAVRGDAVASIPLSLDGNPALIVSMRRRADQPFEPEMIQELRAHLEPFAQAMRLTERANRGLWHHGTDRIREGVGALTAPGRPGVKIATAAALLASLAFFFGSVDYDLTVPCVVAPTHVRHVAAPFDSILGDALVVEGARVQRGDLLCQLDHRDLDQQRIELFAERAVLERTVDRARADDQPVEVQLALANQRLVQAKLDIIQRRIEQCAIRAPIDGVVVAGDLRKRVGSVFVRGEELFSVAPLDQWTIALEVPDSGSADLSVGLVGYFAGYARPEQAHTFTVTRILADAQNRDGRNIYIAEADVDAPSEWLRPGMEGVAKVHLGPRRICWIALHRFVDYLRLKLWL